MAVSGTSRRGPAKGFTLIEMMITVAIVAILAAIAYPAYGDYVKRGKLVEGTNALSSMRALMERHFQDDRSYKKVNLASPCDAASLSTLNGSLKNFTVSCPTLTDTTYTVQAAGSGGVSGFTYTIDQNGTMVTTALPSGWGSVPANGCWVISKGGTC
jgi:type IV pilus assembly protein PilE